MGNALTNWAGNVTFQAERLTRPSSLAELQGVVARANHVRSLGTGHSFNELPDTSGDLVSVAGLPPRFDLDRDRRTVTVSGGLRYGEITGRLQAAGFALHNLGSLPHISVTGACATGTHGSGERNGNLATAVSALELVTAGGDLVELHRDVERERFAGAVVSLGCLGVVTAVTLDIVPTFTIAQYVYDDLPYAEAHEHLLDILAGGYSVSLFTTWQRSPLDQVWVKRRVEDDAAWQPPTSLFGARLADGPRHPLPGMSTINCTAQLGVPGAWHERLPHFRLEFTPSAGEELQSEYLLPRHHSAAALEALSSLAHHVAPVLQICEIRTVKGDDLWLSPSYDRDTVAFHFTWIKDEAAVAPVLRLIEAQLAPFAARPHWGKVFSTAPEVVSGLYERLPDFRRLCKDLDPGGKFRNSFVDRYLAVG